MVPINEVQFKYFFESYKKSFATNIPNEKYKWVALKQFQDHWNIDARDFREMLAVAMSKTENLLASRNNFPLGMMLDFSKTDAEIVRGMFRNLFDETKDLFERIQNFKTSCDSLLADKTESGEFQPGLSHFQSLNSISTYLWLRYPEKYYIYKYSEAKCVANKLETCVEIRSGIHKDTVEQSLALYDSITVFIQNDGEYKTMLAEALDGNCYRDDSMHLATIDFVYFLNNYYSKNVQAAPDVCEADGPVPPSTCRYWWLNANPKIWSAGIGWPVGAEEEYTLLSESGHKRRIYQNFLDAHAGDKVVCYESTPTKQVVALAEVTFRNDTLIGFKKVANLATPIDLADLKSMPELEKMEFFVNPKGSFFKLTQEEYEAIMELVSDADTPVDHSERDAYTDIDFLNEVFMSRSDMNTLEYLLRYKKNVILQGAPGVGKTFSAKRLAYKMMGMKDERRICLVQFHQNYSYEDFVLGYKPVEEGFKLQEGRFYNFCVLAANDPDHTYFFIIDEINRGNVSKIFGELLMAIESGYRGTKIRLAYGEKEFSVPKNLCIIGMMNTADRSIAMIDYALRRRFSFFKMRPGFETEGFSRLLQRVNNDKLNRLVDAVKSLNEAIARDASLGEGFEIGHSYFCKEGDVDDMWLSTLVEYDLIPQLEEYWFDNDKEVEKWSEQLRMAIR